MSPKLPASALKRMNRRKLIGLVALLAFLLFLLLTVENLLVSALLAFVIAYTVGPLVNYVERQGVSRGWATSFAFIGIGVILGLAGLWLFPYLGETLPRLQSDTPRYINGVGTLLSDLEARVRALLGPSFRFDLTGRVQNQLTDWTQSFFQTLPNALKACLTILLLSPFMAFFMVKDSRAALRGVLGLVPNHLFEAALNLQHQINFQIGQFVRARILESLIVGIVTTSGLLLISFPYPVLLGVFAGLTNFIPYLGPLMGAAPAFMIALVNGYSLLGVLLMALVYLIAQAIDAGFLIPLMVAKIVDLHPVTVIIVIIAGAQVMGILGMMISIPVASTLKVTVSTIYRHLTDTRS